MVIIKEADFMKPKNKLMNKKGQISAVLSGIFSGVGNFFKGIGDGIKSIIDIIPKPIKIVLFLLMILLLGNFINLGIRYFGIQCNSGGTPVKISNLLKNTQLMGAIPDYDNLNLYGVPVKITDNNLLTNGEGCTQYYNGALKFVGNDTIFYSNQSQYFYKSYCVFCPNGEVDLINISQNKNLLRETFLGYYCLGNAMYNDDKGLWTKFKCDIIKSEVCQPPKDYYYDYHTDVYVCGINCTGDDLLTMGEVWNKLLEESGAVPLYPSDINISDEQGIKRAVGITCPIPDNPKGSRVPRLGVFGIDVFNYVYWVLGLVIAVLVWVAINLKKI